MSGTNGDGGERAVTHHGTGQKRSDSKKNKIRNVQQMFFRTQVILIVTLAVLMGVAGLVTNIHFETEKRDRNLQNVAEVIARSLSLAEKSGQSGYNAETSVLTGYLDSLKEALGDIDVISVVSSDSVRLYHSNHELIGTIYDGTLPDFETQNFYAANDSGPSGAQRRSYAAIYNEKGEYIGFVMAIMLMENIQSEIKQTLFIFLLITIAATLVELLVSVWLSGSVKKRLLGYEPDVFAAMYQMRDNILESLDEGILAVDGAGTVQFANHAAAAMLANGEAGDGAELVGRRINSLGDGTVLVHTLESGEKEFNGNLGNSDILIDCIPIKEDGRVAGAIGILHNRAEYTKLMEDLAGTRYLVDSMRANNHDFTNKLHVILGLLQMEMYDEAASYIQNITIVQRAAISRIMNSVSEPAVAALLIGKTARASELNIQFVLREGCCYSGTDMSLPSEVLVTVIGNLIDNAFEEMNENDDFDAQKELLFGIYSRPGAVLITTDDTGRGIPEEDMERIFENGYSTKGEGRGTGLYQVKKMVEGLGGKITVESQVGVGTSFSVSFTSES